MDNKQSLKLLIFIVAYNAESTLAKALARIPESIYKQYDTNVLVIDDSSLDRTFQEGVAFSNLHPGIKITVMRNPENQGYGGNQKLGYNYAVKYSYDIVILLHGDGQYAPECLPCFIEPIASGEAGAVFGSRMIGGRSALKGGMPLYKFIGNKILTNLQNTLMKSNLSEWHTGYRAYSVRVLSGIPFERNDNGFPFDTDIILQLIQKGIKIKEIPIPTFYGEEICYVNGLRYALQTFMNTLKCRLHNLSLLYERKYDCDYGKEAYTLKLGYPSSHTAMLSEIKDNSVVLNLGAGAGLLARELKKKSCTVIGIDKFNPDEGAYFDLFLKCKFPVSEKPWGNGYRIDYVLLSGVIEHMIEPEEFLDNLRNWLQGEQCTVIITSPNIAFFISRIQLLMGSFNYTKRGTLDKTQVHLFTFSSLKKLLIQSGYKIISIRGIPAPFPEVIPSSFIALLLIKINQLLINLWRNLFSYQMMIIAKPYPNLDMLLSDSIEHSKELLSRLQQ